MMDDGWGWHGWLFMTVMMLIWLLLVAGLFIALVRPTRWGVGARDNRRTGGTEETFRILDERLARGDIDPEEYEKRRSLLRSS
jgi:putative membrane protein